MQIRANELLRSVGEVDTTARMIDPETAIEAFNLLCGNKLGGGVHRDVFVCRIDPTMVVKVETDMPWRYFANAMEMRFWNRNEHLPQIAQWLAPCKFMSPDGRIMLQRRAEPVRSSDQLPDKLPSFLIDIKRENFGFINGKLVCVDYAMHLDNPNKRLKKVEWNDV